jgi:hypothetical protein
LRLLDGGSQRLLANHVFAGLKSLASDGIVLRVRRTDVDYIHLRIGQDDSIIANHRGNAEAGAQ